MIWMIFTKILKNTAQNMIVDMFTNKKLNPIVTEWFIRGRKLKISLVFIAQSYFAVSKNIDQIQHIILLWKFQTKEKLNKLHLIIHQILSRLYESL